MSLQESEKIFRSIIETIPLPIVLDDAQGNIIYLNKSFIQTMGYTMKEIPTLTDWWSLAYPDPEYRQWVIDNWLSRMEEARHSEMPFTPLEVKIKCKNESLNTFMAAATPLEKDGDGINLVMLYDITTLKNTEKALRLSEQHAHAFAQELDLQKYALDQHALVTATDVNGCITYANELFCEISGYTRDELLGQDHILLNSGYHPHGFFKNMYHTISGGNIWNGEICNRAKDGSLYWVYATIAPSMGPGGKPQQYIAIRTDITARKKAEEAAYAANNAKSEFLANMSHEIRTPLNGVIGVVDILQQTQLTAEQGRLLRTIQNSSLSLLSILNDILDFSKIEARKLTIELIPTSLREVIEEAAQLIISTAEIHSIELSIFVSSRLPPWTLTDPTRLRQILLNLIGNAVKFTSGKPSQSGKIYLRATLLDGDIPKVQLSIRDNGIGMSQETQEKLFQPFTQADASTSRKFGGTGLGLCITHRLIELMGGTISVNSILNQGTEFIVELPFKQVQLDQTSIPSPDLTELQVLLVSRDENNIEALTDYCRAANANVTTVADWVAAHAYIKNIPLSTSLVILLDLDISLNNETDPIERKRIVQLRLRGKSDIPTDIISVHARPMLYQDLIQGLAIASGRIKPNDTGTAKNHSKQVSPPSINIEQAILSKRLILLAEDNEINREVMQEQLRLLGYASEIAEDGVIALKKWRSGRYALLLTDCHMPNMDGFELTAQIRREENANSRLPIIAVTANALQGENERCLKRGMDDYLAKPLRLDQLRTILDKWLPKQQMTATETITAINLKTPENNEVELPVWDVYALTRVIGNNPEMHQRVLQKFLLNAQEQVDNLRFASTSGNSEIAIRAAHTLKSTARTVGAMQLGELCQKIEQAMKAENEKAGSVLANELQEHLDCATELIIHKLNACGR